MAQTTIDVQNRTGPDTPVVSDTPFTPDYYLPDLDLTLDTECSFYTRSRYTMRPVLLLGRYLTHRNKTESLTLGNFIFELLKNLAGTLDYSVLTLPLPYSWRSSRFTLLRSTALRRSHSSLRCAAEM